MVVNGGEQDKLRKIIDWKTTLGWFSLMITRLCFGYGGDWWWEGEPQENYWKRLLWVGSTLESHGFVLDMVVNGDWKNLKKIIGKKTTLGWFNLRIPKLCFGYGGEWWWRGKPQENHWQKLLMGAANSRITRLCFRYGGGEKTLGKSVEKTTLGWFSLRLPRVSSGIWWWMVESRKT